MRARDFIAQLPHGKAVRPHESQGDRLGAASEQPTQVTECEIKDGVIGGLAVEPASHSGFTHFLDGAQMVRRCGYVGFLPISIAHTSAALIAREDRALRTDSADRRASLDLYLPEDFADMAEIQGVDRIVPVREKAEKSYESVMYDAIGQQRKDKELDLAHSFQGGLLAIDGGISELLSEIDNVVGLVKSHEHRYLPDALLLGLNEGERSGVFVRPATPNQKREAYSFYLRMRAAPDEGPLHGLLRIEMPYRPAFKDRADEIASFVLAERAPLSLPDPRYDRLIYPIHLVEEVLRAHQPTEFALTGILS